MPATILRPALPRLSVGPGTPQPAGATPVPGGVNFAVPAATAAGLRLVLFDPDDGSVRTEIDFPAEHRVG
ncbi:hypothetical protein, partial [Streptomyces sp. Tu 6176]